MTIVNKDNVEEADRADQGFYIRNGIVVIVKMPQFLMELLFDIYLMSSCFNKRSFSRFYYQIFLKNPSSLTLSSLMQRNESD